MYKLNSLLALVFSWSIGSDLYHSAIRSSLVVVDVAGIDRSRDSMRSDSFHLASMADLREADASCSRCLARCGFSDSLIKLAKDMMIEG